MVALQIKVDMKNETVKEKLSLFKHFSLGNSRMGWDALHCHLVSMVTCYYGNRPWMKLGSRDEGF